MNRFRDFLIRWRIWGDLVLTERRIVPLPKIDWSGRWAV